MGGGWGGCTCRRGDGGCEHVAFLQAHYSTGKVSASFTSTAMVPETTHEAGTRCLHLLFTGTELTLEASGAFCFLASASPLAPAFFSELGVLDKRPLSADLCGMPWGLHGGGGVGAGHS